MIHHNSTDAFMHFIWPHFLWCFSLALALPLVYLWLLKRKQRFAFTYSNLSIIRQALGPRHSWRRHTPPALLWLALCVAIVGAARPTAQVTLPADYMTLVLAVDVSRSMLAEDVEPNRIQAAQATVKDFLRDLPNNIRVGIVSFAGTAQLVQQITDEREALVASVDRFQLQRGTATGSGLLLALSTLLPSSGVDLQAAIYGDEFGRWGSKPLTERKPSAPVAPAAPPVPPALSSSFPATSRGGRRCARVVQRRLEGTLRGGGAVRGRLRRRCLRRSCHWRDDRREERRASTPRCGARSASANTNRCARPTRAPSSRSCQWQDDRWEKGET